MLRNKTLKLIKQTYNKNSKMNTEHKKSKLILRKNKDNVPLLLNYSYIFKIS